MNVKKLAFTTCLCLLFSIRAFAQTPTPTPPEKVKDDEVVKITTTLIQIDVTVTDRDGKIVRDLKPEDFEVYENQEKRTITNFSFVESEPSAVKTPSEKTNAANPKANAGALPLPPPPGARLKRENVRRTMAFVVDDLLLNFDGIYFIRKALKNFVDRQMQDDDLVAIIRTSAGISALQQFTSDKRQLYAAIENIRWKPATAGQFGSSPRETPTPGEENSESDKDLKEAEAEYNDFRQSVFTTGTLGAVAYVVNGMAELPGRKSIMLVSDGISLKKPDRQINEKTAKALKSLIEAANRSSVVIYTMSANGIAFDRRGFTAEDGAYPQVETAGDKSELQALLENGNTQALDQFERREGLVRLSRETGGLAIINQKELNTNIQKMLDDQKGYYLIGYQPDDETFDPKTARFNRLNVKVKRPGLSVRYRSGFFGISDEVVQQPRSGAAQSAQQRLVNAMTSPFGASGVHLRLNAMFDHTPRTGPFIRSLLHVDTKDLKFTDEPGGKKAVFTVFAYTFKDNGDPIDTINKVYTLRIKPEFYQRLLDKGFVYNINLPIKKAGVYQLRVALRDEQEEKIGAANQFIEVPDLKKNRLTLSGIILQTITQEQFKKFSGAPNAAAAAADQNKEEEIDAETDTALRRFRRGMVLQYNYTVYNGKTDKAKGTRLEAQARIFRDGKLVFEGKFAPLAAAAGKEQPELQGLGVNGALALSPNMALGDYVLQVVVRDTLAKEKHQIATQWVDFEIIQ